MYYSEDEARKRIIEAGHKLIEQGLVARTWGNISARISREEFLITPSGRTYETLSPAELVRVRVEDCSYEGDIMPSCEKGVHAVSYALRPDIGFVVHTHQFYATVVSICGRDTQTAACAEYALPGSDDLKNKVMDAISKNPSKAAFLMKRHGALCLGTDYENTFELAAKLEEECKAIFQKFVDSEHYIEDCAKQTKILRPYLDDFAQILGAEIDLSKGTDVICRGEDSEAQYRILEKNCAAALMADKTGVEPMGPEDIHQQRTFYLTKYSKLKK